MKFLKAKRYACDSKTNFDVIQGELLTPNEINRYCPTIPACVFEEVEIDIEKTFKYFGCRFIIKREL